MELPSTRKLVGKVDSKGKAVHPQENSFDLYETIVQIFTQENDMIGHIYCNVGKLGAVATSMNRGFWGVESSDSMVAEGCSAVAEYILRSHEEKDNKNTSKVFILFERFI